MDSTQRGHTGSSQTDLERFCGIVAHDDRLYQELLAAPVRAYRRTAGNVVDCSCRKLLNRAMVCASVHAARGREPHQ